MEYIIFIVFAVGIVFLIFLKGYLDYRKEEKKFIQRLYSDYGKTVEKEYKPERYGNIRQYYEKHKKGFSIDDITWNDLNMDEVFKKANYTFSAAGEEYLYHMLRTPSFSQEELNRREELIDYFFNHEDERVRCQFLFHKLGNTGKYSLYDYLDYLDVLGKRSNVRHYLALLLIIVGIIVMFIDIPVGLVVLVGVFVANILSYFKVKSEIDPYITSFSYIFRLIDMIEKIRKIKIPVLTNEWQELKEASMGLARFKRGAFLLMSPGRLSATGNPLEIILDYLRMALHLDLIQFNKMLFEVRKHISDIDRMVTIAGEIDSVIAIGAFRKNVGNYCVPVFESGEGIKAENLYHPLLFNPVKNDMNTVQSVLITGSNASGKSTFLKTVALNAIFAQTMHTVLADSYKSSFYRVCSSMTLRDDIEGGDSYYMVEIKALKRILDEVKKEGAKVLCFVDEVLRGTNTVERIAASTQILKSLCMENCLCFAATHDIELTYLLENDYINYHFKEEIEDDDIYFSYKIIDGRAQTRNAIKLLGIMGYEPEIVQKAEKLAADYLKQGNWSLVCLDE